LVSTRISNDSRFAYESDKMEVASVHCTFKNLLADVVTACYILQNTASRVAQVLYLHVRLSWYVGNRLERDNPLSHNTVSIRSPEVYRILYVKL